MERKARNGEWCGGFVPYGYQKVEGEIAINEDEAAVVRRIFDWAVNGGLGAKSIAAKLVEENIPYRGGQKWCKQRVNYILNNHVYYGAGSWNRTHTKRAAHRNGHRHRYYACANRSYHRGCDLPFIRADLVEPPAVKEIESIFSRPEPLQRVQDMVAAQFQAERPEIRRELQKVEEDIAQTRNALDRYFAAFESGALKPEVLAEKIDEVNLRLQQLEEEKDQIEGEMAQLTTGEVDADSFNAYLEALKVTLEGSENEAKKHMLRLLVEKVLVHDRGHIEFWFKLPDGSTVKNALENAKTCEANACSVNELTAQVCNHDNAAPHMERT